MRAVVVYESLFGNTRRIAEAIAEGSRSQQPPADVACVPVTEVTAAIVGGADLLVVGGPTHMRGLARAREWGAGVSRRLAA
jgi:flavodoxin